jgi:hypothetical protein
MRGQNPLAAAHNVQKRTVFRVQLVNSRTGAEGMIVTRKGSHRKDAHIKIALEEGIRFR